MYIKSLTATKQERVNQMVDLLNEYKDFLEEEWRYQ